MSVNKIFATGLLIAVTVPHESEKRYIWAFWRTVLVVIGTIVLIKFTLWLLQPFNTSGVNHPNQGRSPWTKYAQKLHSCWLARMLRSLAAVFPQSLRNDTIIVVWLLIALFQLANTNLLNSCYTSEVIRLVFASFICSKVKANWYKFQGTLDACRDAINDTSLLPVISFVTPEKQLVLGRNLDNLLINPSLKGYRIIGDQGLFDYLRGRETNDVATPDNPRVWRLLLENKGWFYLFPGLPPKAESEQRPPILAIRDKGNGELIILSPDYTKPPAQ